jgi:hypothetical protein
MNSQNDFPFLSVLDIVFSSLGPQGQSRTVQLVVNQYAVLQH